MYSGFTGVHYLPCLTSFELVMNALVVKAVPTEAEHNTPMQILRIHLSWLCSTCGNNDKTMVQTQAINKGVLI